MRLGETRKSFFKFLGFFGTISEKKDRLGGHRLFEPGSSGNKNSFYFYLGDKRGDSKSNKRKSVGEKRMPELPEVETVRKGAREW